MPTNLDFWKTMIAFGKPHTMMPGFARAQGGPLSDEQITSLAAYLDRTISHQFPPPATNDEPPGPRAALTAAREARQFFIVDAFSNCCNARCASRIIGIQTQCLPVMAFRLGAFALARQGQAQG